MLGDESTAAQKAMTVVTHSISPYAASLPPHESERLRALSCYSILDTPAEPDFDDLVHLAAELCQAPIALISLVDKNRQWFKAKLGLDVCETPRDQAFCAHALLQPESLLIVPDATADPRFADNPLVTGEPFLRAYAGAPLVTADGHALGTLCVLDRVPRPFTASQCESLHRLSRQVVAQLELKRIVAEQQRTNEILRATQTFAEQVADNAHSFLYIYDLRAAEWVYVNGQMRAFLGVAETKGPPLPGFGLLSALHPDSLSRDTAAPTWTHAHFAAFENHTDDEIVEFEVRLRHQDGTYRWVWVRERVFRRDTPGGIVTQVMGTALDITARETAKDALLESETRFRTATEALHEGLVLQNHRGEIIICNPRAEEILGLSAAQMAGRTSLDPRWRAIHPDGSDWPGNTHPANLTLGDGLPRRDVLMGIHKPSGDLTWITINAVPLFDQHAQEGSLPSSVVVTFADVTERKHLEDERERLMAETIALADLDPLTSLTNHRTFHHRLHLASEAIGSLTAPQSDDRDAGGSDAAPDNALPAEPSERRRRGAGREYLAVAVLDMDNFKFFNDTYGHLTGDEVLCHVAAGLRSQCRSDDVVARIGGDEFAILLPSTTRARARAWARRLQRWADAQSFQPDGEGSEVPLRLSVGVALYPGETESAAAALYLADKRAMEGKGGSAASSRRAAALRQSLTGEIEGFSMLDALVSAVDNKDRYTRRHSENVMEHALHIADALSLSDEQKASIQVAALVHDVGKIGVPSRVLRQPGKLSDIEYEAIRSHPVLGGILVGAVPELAHTLEAVRFHHERWDGGGYPSGLQGEAIPQSARILAVADAYSAMTMDRPYRKGLSADEANRRLRAGAGSQWDAVCVHALLRSPNDST